MYIPVKGMIALQTAYITIEAVQHTQLNHSEVCLAQLLLLVAKPSIYLSVPAKPRKRRGKIYIAKANGLFLSGVQGWFLD